MTPEQNKVIERCAHMLKTTFGGLKHIVFDLAPEKEEDTVRCEYHWKVKVKPE